MFRGLSFHVKQPRPLAKMLGRRNRRLLADEFEVVATLHFRLADSTDFLSQCLDDIQTRWSAITRDDNLISETTQRCANKNSNTAY